MELMENITVLATKLEKRIQKVSEEIGSLPEGNLVRYRRNGKTLYYHAYKADGREKRRYIDDNKELINKLCRRHYLQIESKLLKENIKTLNKFKDKMYEDSPENIFEMMPERFKDINPLHFLEQTDAVKYAVSDYERSTYKQEYLKHKTPLGFSVRSKSELIITLLLLKHNVKFHYEEVMHTINGVYIPDFTIISPGGNKIYWEHCGRTFDKEYIIHHYEKMEAYAKEGIGPWKNLIVTYDDEDGNIDQSLIEAEIKNKILTY